MLPQIEPLFSLTDPAQKLSIDFALKSCFCLLQEGDCGFYVRKLPTHTDRDDGILKGLEFGAQWLDHFVVEQDQVLVFCLIESGVLNVANQVVRNLVPHSKN